MFETTIPLSALLAVALFSLLAGVVVREMRRGRREPAMPQPAGGELRHDIAQTHPLKILVATDGSTCSECALASVASRPWPPKSEIEIATVVHREVVRVPDPFLGGTAAHVTGLEEDRRHASDRVHLAEQQLAGIPAIVSSTILEGDPAGALLSEARRWKADLIVVGSHGRRPAERLLGSVAQFVAQHADCSVEIVRGHHLTSTAGPCRPSRADVVRRRRARNLPRHA